LLGLRDDDKRRGNVDDKTRSTTEGQFRVMDRDRDCHPTIDLCLGYERVPRYDQPGGNLSDDGDDIGYKTILVRKEDFLGSIDNLRCHLAAGVHRLSLRDTVWQIQLYIIINAASFWSPIIDSYGVDNDAFPRMERERVYVDSLPSPIGEDVSHGLPGLFRLGVHSLGPVSGSADGQPGILAVGTARSLFWDPMAKLPGVVADSNAAHSNP